MPNTLFTGPTVDDVIRLVIEEIFARGKRIYPGKGQADEITGILLEVSNPRARLSRTETRGRVFSALGELCWYLARSRDAEFASYYISKYRELEEAGEIFGGYGPRFFDWRGVNQVSKIIEILKTKKDSRQVVIQVFDALDLSVKHKDVPCTCSLQFLLREGKLDLFVNMRSNDVHSGLPHDVFCFTMLQEIVARSVSAELGTYKQAIGSMHLYVKDIGPAKRFLNEGWQQTKPIMPTMPEEDPWEAVAVLLEAESIIRNRGEFREERLHQINPYWADLIRLLQVLAAKKLRDPDAIHAVREKMSSSIYFPFIDRAIRQTLASKPLESTHG